MEANPDPIIPGEDVLEGMEDQTEAAIQETTGLGEERIQTAIEIATADVADGNTRKL